MKRISIYPNLQRDPELTVAKRICRTLLSVGAQVILHKKWQPYLSSLPKEGLHFTSEAGLWSCDLLVVLGGDGTVLTAAKKAAVHHVPVFGINLGNVGFLASLEAKDADRIGRIFQEELILSPKMLLSATVNGNKRILAMNEFLVQPEKGFHLVDLSLSADGRQICNYRADGLILHTPTGSTGYALSAGGALVENSFDCIGVLPISPYMRRNAQHMIFSPETEFILKREKNAQDKVVLCADGGHTVPIEFRDQIRIAKAKESAVFASFRKDTNVDVYFRKFQEQI